MYKCQKFWPYCIITICYVTVCRVVNIFLWYRSTGINDLLICECMEQKQCNLLSKISVSAAFRAVSSGAKSLELQLAQVSQRMKGSLLPASPCSRRKSKSGYGSREPIKVDNNKLFWSTIKFVTCSLYTVNEKNRENIAAAYFEQT